MCSKVLASAARRRRACRPCGRRRAAHVGLVGVGSDVEDLVDEVGGLGEPRELLVARAPVAHLQLQVGDDRDQVGVAGALAEAVDRALHLARADLDGRERVGDGALGVVVAVDAERERQAARRARPRRRRADLRRQRAAVGVAQHDRSAPASAAARMHRSAYPARRDSRRRSARRRRRTRLPAPTRKATDSSIIAQVLLAVTSTTFSRCSTQVLPTSVQTGATDSASTAGPRRRSAATPRRRVMPNAAICACEALAGEQLEQLALLRVRRREAGLDQVDAELVEACATRSFSSAESDMPSPRMPSRRVASYSWMCSRQVLRAGRGGRCGLRRRALDGCACAPRPNRCRGGSAGAPAAAPTTSSHSR